MGVVSGNMLGVQISMRVEKKIGAASDAHIKNPLEERLKNLEQKIEELLK